MYAMLWLVENTPVEQRALSREALRALAISDEGVFLNTPVLYQYRVQLFCELATNAENLVLLATDPVLRQFIQDQVTRQTYTHPKQAAGGVLQATFNCGELGKAVETAKLINNWIGQERPRGVEPLAIKNDKPDLFRLDTRMVYNNAYERFWWIALPSAAVTAAGAYLAHALKFMRRPPAVANLFVGTGLLSYLVADLEAETAFVSSSNALTSVPQKLWAAQFCLAGIVLAARFEPLALVASTLMLNAESHADQLMGVSGWNIEDAYRKPTNLDWLKTWAGARMS